MIMLLLLAILLFLLLLPVYLLELRSSNNVIEVSLPYNPALLHHDYLIHCLGKLNSMGGHYDGLALQIPQQSLSHQKLSHMHIYCT